MSENLYHQIRDIILFKPLTFFIHLSKVRNNPNPYHTHKVPIKISRKQRKIVKKISYDAL